MLKGGRLVVDDVRDSVSGRSVPTSYRQTTTTSITKITQTDKSSYV